MTEAITPSELARHLTQISQTDQDSVVVLTGTVGSGKSTLAIRTAKKMNGFDMEQDILYTKREMSQRIKQSRDQPLIIDEAINVLFSRESMTKTQKEIIRLLDMCRDHHLTLFLCLPNFWSLDSHVRNSRIRYWIYVDERGVGYIFEPDKNPFTKDAWHSTYNEKLLQNWNRGTHPKKSINYVDTILFDDIPPTVKERYLRIKREKKQDAEKEEQNQKILLETEEKDVQYSLMAELVDKKIIRSCELEKYFAQKEKLTTRAIRMRIQKAKQKERERQEGYQYSIMDTKTTKISSKEETQND